MNDMELKRIYANGVNNHCRKEEIAIKSSERSFENILICEKVHSSIQTEVITLNNHSNDDEGRLRSFAKIMITKRLHLERKNESTITDCMIDSL